MVSEQQTKAYFFEFPKFGAFHMSETSPGRFSTIMSDLIETGATMWKCIKNKEQAKK
jgi:hypothetical protein